MSDILHDPFGASATLESAAGAVTIFRLKALDEQGLANTARLPYSIRVLLEAELGNLLAARRFVKELQQRPGLEAYGAAVEGDLEAAQQQLDVAESHQVHG